MSAGGFDEGRAVESPAVTGIAVGSHTCMIFFGATAMKLTVHLISIVQPQIEGKFTASPGGITSVFCGCID